MNENDELSKEELTDALLSALQMVKDKNERIDMLKKQVFTWITTAQNIYSQLHGTSRGFDRVLEQVKQAKEIAELRRMWDL